MRPLSMVANEFGPPEFDQERVSRDLEIALRNNQVRRAYLPLVRLDTRVCIGFEVLARWDHPEHGSVPPDVFIQAAEATGLIHEVDRYMVATAIADIASLVALHDVATKRRKPRFGINLSVMSLQPGLPRFIADQLERHNLPADLLVFEVTETMTVPDLERSARVLTTLSGMGARIALDDFGTGYASLSTLSELPIDVLKIDRSFVAGMHRSIKARRLVEAGLAVSEIIGIPAVAEGLETADQVELLRTMGCRTGQGWYFSKPVSIEIAGTLVNKQLPHIDSPTDITTAATRTSAGTTLLR